MKHIRYASVALLGIVSVGVAQQMQQRPKNAVPPEVANANAIKLLSQIDWKNSLDEALAQAKKDGKLIFYMHMLGKIDGDT